MKTKIICITLLILLLGQWLYGQLRFDRFAVNPKIGTYSTFKESGGIVGGMEINTTYEKWMFSLDYYYLDEFTIVFYDKPLEYYNQIGFMAGSYLGEGFLRCQFQAGVAPIWGLRRTALIKPSQFLGGDEYDSEKFLTVRGGSEIRLKINPWENVGFGIDLQTNINSKNTFWMPLLSVEFGKIRTK
ncbi:MAG: hypothetical protein IPP49_13270 [Saprospiraceae bacterium]|nr:hypothetical protein [Saprospiraceae bacterium]